MRERERDETRVREEYLREEANCLNKVDGCLRETKRKRKELRRYFISLHVATGIKYE